jgi:hypothetical protein
MPAIDTGLVSRDWIGSSTSSEQQIVNTAGSTSIRETP